MNFMLRRTLIAAIFVVGFTSTVMAEKPAEKKDAGAEKVKTRTVTASMAHAVGQGVGINAAPKPSPFTIGKGQVAYDFRYSFSDPKQNVKIKHKGPGNIYSVTKRKYITIAAPAPDFTLSEGKYKFFVGGTPGASGSMSFKIKDASQKDSHDKKELEQKADRIIDTVTWIADQAEEKTKATFYVRGTKVTGIIDQEYKGTSNKDITFEKTRFEGTFLGTIAGNVITGIWKFKVLPRRVIVHGRDGKDIGRKDWSSMTIDSVTTLKKGGTLTETLKITGTSNTQWDVGAPGDLSGKLQSNNYTTTIPGEFVKQPMQGTWKEKKKK